MDVFKTLKPNDPGTKRLAREYGEKLVAVRYRKSVNPAVIYTTVEIIVDQKEYVPGITHVPAKSAKDQQQVPIRITYHETEIRERIKAAGAFWHVEQKLWYLEYSKVCSMGLKERMVKINV